MSLTKKINLLGVVGLGLVALFISGIALAQTETTTVSTDIPKELVFLAQDLGCQTKEQCALKFDANLEQGITLAQKYDIYTPEQEKIATTFKTEVLERLKTVSQDNFEEEILALANKILKEKPALAKTMSLTRQTVNAAETIINTVKDAGVDIRTCQKSPEDLSREQLIACVKAGNNLSSKGTIVEDYIPKGNAKAGEVEQMLALENSLLAGEYAGLGKARAEEAGQICLKPGSESVSDCDRIAQKFFGPEGVQELQRARQQTTRIKEYYTEGIERMELVTPDGQKLIGKGAIRNACDRAFENSNLGLARACGNFAVKNGYASQEDIEDGLKIMETFSQKGGDVNFDDCRFNPESCKEFLPDEFRSQFDSQFEIFRIMSESIGFDPARCENSYDADIGKRCLEGAKKALSRVEEIAQKSPAARRIVDEIKGHITEGERMTERRDEFNQNASIGGMAGPGGCQGPEECFKYCSQATNSAECISFGAKSQIFDQNTIVQRFNNVNEQFNISQNQPYPVYPYSPQDNSNFPNTFPNQPNQIDQRSNQYPYPYQPQQSVGPSPECFAAISSGDFAKAKTACSSMTENYPKPIVEPFPVCPAYSMPSPCPEGQMRQQASDAKGCMAYGACIAIEDYRPIDTTPKPCPAGTYWNGTTCVANPTTSNDMSSACAQAGGTWDTLANYCKMPNMNNTPCPSGMWWDGATQSCKSSTVPTVGSCDYSTQYWKAATSQCQPRTSCYDTTNSDYNSMECQGVRGATTSFSSGCGSLTTQAMCQASSGCGWANGACGGNMMNNTACSMGQYWNGTSCINSSTTGQCPAGQYWYTPSSGGSGYCMSSTSSGNCPAGYHPHSESGGFCMNDQENYSGTCYNSAGTSTMTCPQNTYMGSSCTSGQYWNGTACVSSTTSTTTCPSGQYWNGSACATSTTSSSDMLAGCTQAGGTWNTSNNYCQMPTCPSGQYWYVPSSGGTGYCMTTSTTDCPSGQYWNGSSCVSNTTTSSDMSSACAQAGGTWSSSSNYCQMPTTTTGSSSCTSGQYWNGSSCVSSTTSGSSTCTSSQYWDGTACVNSPTSSSTTTSSSSDMSASCAQAGGSWNGSSCVMPTSMVLCSKSGGNWTGVACNLAKNISDQKDYYAYYQKQSGSLLGQAIGAFVDLFR